MTFCISYFCIAEENTIETYAAMPANATVKPLASFGAIEAKHLVLFCHDLVTELVNQSLEDLLHIVCKDKLSAIIFKLRESLLEELQGCDIKSNRCSIPAIITEVSRELHQTMGTKKSIEIALLLQQSQDYQLIAKILKKHLLIVQGSIVTWLGNSLLTVARAGLLCCFILPQEEDYEIAIHADNDSGKVFLMQPERLYPRVTLE